MGKADLHIHTTYSLDGTATVRAVMKKASELGLNVIAITDHDQIKGSLEARELASAYGIEVIPGSEISTASGHLLALDIQTNIPKGLSLEETIRQVADQGGLCIAPHPGGPKSNSLRPEVILKVMRQNDLAQYLVGIEVFNAGMIQLKRNLVAMDLARRLPVAEVGNSDAHLLWMIGKGATFFEGSSADDFKRSLLARETVAVMSKPDPRIAVATYWMSRIAMRFAGWGTINLDPQAPTRFARLATAHQYEAVEF